MNTLYTLDCTTVLSLNDLENSKQSHAYNDLDSSYTNPVLTTVQSGAGTGTSPGTQAVGNVQTGGAQSEARLGAQQA